MSKRGRRQYSEKYLIRMAEIDAAESHYFIDKISDIMVRDPEFKYWLMVIGGGGLMVLGQLLNVLKSVAKAQNDALDEDERKAATESAKTQMETLLKMNVSDTTDGGTDTDAGHNFAWIATGGARQAILSAFGSGVSGGGNSFFGMNMSGIATLAGAGLAGFGAAILILKAIFGTGGASEVLKGLGEIIPL